MAYYPISQQSKDKYNAYFFRGFTAKHLGLDITPKIKSYDIPIIASTDGTIIVATKGGDGELFVDLLGLDKRTYRNVHLDRFACKVGDKVKSGDVIGYMGTTGNSTGIHTHFAIKVGGVFVDPEKQNLEWYNSNNFQKPEMLNIKYGKKEFVTMQFEATVDNLNVRQLPDSDSKSITKLKKGETIRTKKLAKGSVEDGNAIWYKRKHSDGWVSARYLKFVKIIDENN